MHGNKLLVFVLQWWVWHFATIKIKTYQFQSVSFVCFFFFLGTKANSPGHCWNCLFPVDWRRCLILCGSRRSILPVLPSSFERGEVSLLLIPWGAPTEKWQFCRPECSSSRALAFQIPFSDPCVTSFHRSKPSKHIGCIVFREKNVFITGNFYIWI